MAYLIIGIFLLMITIVDLLWTTLWVDGGAGPLSARLTTGLWRGLRKVGSRRSRALSLSGPVMLIASLFMWVVLVWAGWTFLFAGGGGEALYDTRDKEPITWAGRIYFVGYSMFTMGNGDFSPSDGIWQVATGLTTASGMLLVTLAVSYVLSVLGAVTQKRSFASGVTGIGLHSEELLEKAWNGKDLHALDLPLNTLASQLDSLADQHNTYSILHYYHSDRRQTASVVAVVILDEALTMIRYGVPEECRPNNVVLEGARSSVDSYLRTLNSAFIKPADQSPPVPDLGLLRSRGIPVKDQEIFHQRLADMEKRRRKLLGMVHADAWSWPKENDE